MNYGYYDVEWWANSVVIPSSFIWVFVIVAIVAICLSPFCNK